MAESTVLLTLVNRRLGARISVEAEPTNTGLIARVRVHSRAGRTTVRGDAIAENVVAVISQVRADYTAGAGWLELEEGEHEEHAR